MSFYFRIGGHINFIYIKLNMIRLNINYLKVVIQIRNKLNVLQIISCSTLINIALGIFFGMLTNVNNPVFKENYSKGELIFMLVLAGPLIETLIFQGFIISISNNFVKNALFSVFISALIFGLCHNYAIIHQIKTFISGFIYASLYVMYKNKSKSMLIILACHSLYNASIYGIDQMFTLH